MAVTIYFGLKYYVPTIEFRSPAFLGLSTALSNNAGIFASIFIFASAFSAFHAWRRGELLDRQTSIKSIKDMPWKDFEYLVSEAYRRKGYAVQENIGGGADGGVDLVLNKDGRKTLVQCKNWKSSKVGVSTIRELYGLVTAEGVDAGIVVCSGHFTADAIEFAKGKPITLIDGSELSRLIGKVQKSSIIQQEAKDTLCPVCSSPMVLRTARRGNNAGKSFWGCSRYPKCRGTRQV